MRRILLSKFPGALEIPAPGPVVMVYHKQYAKRLPTVDDCTPVEFGRLCETFAKEDLFAGARSVVFVGANKFFNASTRFHPVFDVLQYGLPGIERWSIDTSPYIGPLWRLWSHFSFAGVPFAPYTYSYLLESHYTSYLDGQRAENPLSDDEIRTHARGQVLLDYDRYFGEPVVEIVPVGDDVHRLYAERKEELFATETDSKPVIRGLAQVAKDACKERKIPAEHTLFETPDAVRIVRTDLKVDIYLTSVLLNKMAEVNHICEVLRS
jgi:hypothetical protein